MQGKQLVTPYSETEEKNEEALPQLPLEIFFKILAYVFDCEENQVEALFDLANQRLASRMEKAATAQSSKSRFSVFNFFSVCQRPIERDNFIEQRYLERRAFFHS